MRPLFLLLAASVAFAQVDVFTQHNDNQRSGRNTQEMVLNHQTVGTRFGKLWALYSDHPMIAWYSRDRSSFNNSISSERDTYFVPPAVVSSFNVISSRWIDVNFALTLRF